MKNFLIVLITILVAGSMAYLIYLGVQDDKKNDLPEDISNSQPSSNEAGTYKNQEHGFSIDYPKTAVLSKENIPDISEEIDELAVIFSQDSFQKKDPKTGQMASYPKYSVLIGVQDENLLALKKACPEKPNASDAELLQCSIQKASEGQVSPEIKKLNNRDWVVYQTNRENNMSHVYQVIQDGQIYVLINSFLRKEIEEKQLIEAQKVINSFKFIN